MMSIDLFKSILELRGNLYKNYYRDRKNLFRTLYDYHRLKEFINKNIIYGNNTMSYQLIYNFGLFAYTDSLALKIVYDEIYKRKDIGMYAQWEKDNIEYFYISYTTLGEPSTKYEYRIYPITTPGEIKFEYTEEYSKKDIHESKTFINSLDMDPHKDNMYTTSAKHFSAAKEKINEVIKIFFKYYINRCRQETIRSSILLSLIWRKEL